MLDASGSMYAIWEGKSRMEIAREVLSNLVDSLSNDQNIEVALRVYGHEYHKRYQNCKDTKLEVPFGNKNHEAIKKKLKTIEPNGTTLIAYTLEQAANDFPKDDNVRNILILLTDGIEVCGGDPCAVSLALQKKNIFLTPFIIGIGPEEDFAKELGCIGKYFDANKVSEFQGNLQKILKHSLSETTVRVNLLDAYSKPTETNVNMTFKNSITGEVLHDYVHLIKPNGKSDEVEVDPVITYDIIVNTIPQTVKRNIVLEGGKENIIDISTPQGTLLLKDNPKDYRNLQAIVRKSGSAQTLHVQNAGTQEKYITGNYDIEILTLPRIHLKNVKIEQGKIKSIPIPSPGILNISDALTGYGSIYKIKSNGDPEWVHNFTNARMSQPLQPGNYKVVFRVDKSINSKFTDVKYFTVRSGASVAVKLFSK
ncbi:VWA domain-containing protein [Cytophagaceae bacterium ABcell3]|nr:VWA domain-containing protein [Cytophagaceae bacterium ABcell3]